MAVEPGHIQITEFSKEAIPTINLMLEDLFCRYGTNMPYFCLDFDFPDYSERPDWVSGYNFNLDWGEWGYWLVWFNNLLGLLFDTANLPRWQMPDLSPGSWAMFNSKISELYDESPPRIFIFNVDLVSGDCTIRSYSRNGVSLSNWSVDGNYGPDCLCVDEDDNAYYIDGSRDEIKKFDKNGNLLLTKETNYSEYITTGSDGYIYELGEDDSAKGNIIKRNRSDLSIAAAMPGGDLDLSDYEGFTCDNNGYLYSINRSSSRIEKWDFSLGTRAATHSVSWGSGSSLTALGSVIGSAYYEHNAWTIPTSLDENETPWTLTGLDKPLGAGSIDAEHFLFCGYDTDDDYNNKIAKYTSEKAEKLLDTAMTTTESVHTIKAYPF